MARKNASIDTLTLKFKDMDIAIISLIQASYAGKKYGEIQKAYDSHKKALGKKITVLKEVSLKALGRQASQYINMLNAPRKKEIARINKKFKIKLETINYPKNLISMGNRSKKKYHDGGIVEIGKEKGKVGIPKQTFLDRILSLRGLARVIDKPYGFQSQIHYSKANIMDFMHRMNLTNQEIQELNNNGIYSYQILVKIEYDNGEEGWVSTKNMALGNYQEIERIIDDTNTYIMEGDPYEIDTIMVKFKRIIKIQVNWKN